MPILQQRVLRSKSGKGSRSLSSITGADSHLTFLAYTVRYFLVFLEMLAPGKERLGDKMCCTLLGSI